jgi:type II secretory pathway component GspD/PulD (secretin)
VENQKKRKKRKCIYTKAVFALWCVLFLLTSPVHAMENNKIERMSFTDASVGYILQSLGRVYGVNFSISEGAMSKRVSIELNNVTFTSALDMISQASNIVLSKTGPDLYVARSQEEDMALVSDTEREDARREKRLTSSVVEVIGVKYVSVEDVEEAIKKTIGEDSNTMVKISSVSSEEGRNYNNLVVSTANEKLMATVKNIIAIIDIPKPMVEIEVLFVELIDSLNSETGFDWDPAKTPFTFEEEKSDTGNLDLFRFGTFYRMTPWQAEVALSAIAGDGKSRVLADPRIRVMSGRQAQFASETQVPILSKNSDGEVNTEWKNVGINLQILPVVLNDGTIHLKAAPRASSITGEKKLGDVVAPVISERKAETEVLMQPGETMVIGGLMNDKEIRTFARVPVFSSIPVLGELFKSEKKENEKSTVVIFLRPKIVTDTSATAEVIPATSGKDVDFVSFLENIKKKQEKKSTPADETPPHENGPHMEEALLPSVTQENTNVHNEILEKLRAEVKESEARETHVIEKGSAPKTDPETTHGVETAQTEGNGVSEHQEVKDIPIQEKPRTPEKKHAWEKVDDIDAYLKNLLQEYTADTSDDKEGVGAEETRPVPDKETIPSQETQEKVDETQGQNPKQKKPVKETTHKDMETKEPAQHERKEESTETQDDESGWIPPME